MTALLALDEPRVLALAAALGEIETCAACRVMLPRTRMEPVTTRPWLRRCRDEEACRQRYTPRRLAWSVRRMP